MILNWVMAGFKILLRDSPRQCKLAQVLSVLSLSMRSNRKARLWVIISLMIISFSCYSIKYYTEVITLCTRSSESLSLFTGRFLNWFWDAKEWIWFLVVLRIFMPNKILFLRAKFYSLFHCRFFSLLAVTHFLQWDYCSVNPSSVLDLPKAVRKKAAAFLELLEIVQADKIKE